MLLQTWLFFCATETVLCFTPGPAVLLVISMALARGGSAGLRAATGILFTNGFYFILSATGVGATILASWKLFFLIKWIGAAYLIWLGLRMILSRSDAIGHHPQVETGGRRSPFTHGVVTQGANPKALVFFTALLPQFVDPTSAVVPQIAILGVSSILIELVVLALYAAISHQARAMVRRPAFANSLNRGGGILLIGAGARMPAIHHS